MEKLSFFVRNEKVDSTSSEGIQVLRNTSMNLVNFTTKSIQYHTIHRDRRRRRRISLEETPVVNLINCFIISFSP